MPGVLTALDAVDKFIGIAKELGKLPALALPQYQDAASDLYEICQKLLVANENLSRWLYRFLYFDFRQQDARTEFLAAVQDYRTMKTGPEFQQLKFSCSDIGQVYYRSIDSKLGNWITDQHKLEEAQGIFAALTEADYGMVAFTYDYVVSQLDEFIDQAESHIDVGSPDEAETARLKFKAESREVTDRLEKFSGELAELVMQFAQLARIPITL